MSAVSFQAKSANGKLSPQDQTPYLHPGSGRTFQRPTPKPPYVCSTSVSIKATCPDTCRYKDNGCYEQAGITGGRAKARDLAAAGLSGEAVNALEASIIDEQFPGGVPQDGPGGRGRALRLHVAGDAASAAGAAYLAGAAARWMERGGGAVWTYTARWASIPRAAWGLIFVHASVQTVEEADEAAALGYVPAYSMPKFASKRAYPLRYSKAGLRVIPCPAETSDRDCASCGLCMRHLPEGSAIGFQIHGKQKARHRSLPVVGERLEDTIDDLNALRERGEHQVRRAWDKLGSARSAVREALEAAGIDPNEDE